MSPLTESFKNLALVILLTTLSACGLQKVENFNPTKSSSPKGDYEVIWYNRDAGATTDEATAMLIVRKGTEPNYEDPALVINGSLNVRPVVEWVTDSSVKVRLDTLGIKQSQTFVKKSSQEGVAIECVLKKPE